MPRQKLSWWLASSNPLHQPPPGSSYRLLWCQIKMHHVERALVGWSIARYVPEISRVTEAVRYVSENLQRSRAANSASNLDGHQVASSVSNCRHYSRLTDMHQRLSTSLLLCQMYSTAGEIWALRCATQGCSSCIETIWNVDGFTAAEFGFLFATISPKVDVVLRSTKKVSHNDLLFNQAEHETLVWCGAGLLKSRVWY